jgi:hypothetical protein
VVRRVLAAVVFRTLSTFLSNFIVFTQFSCRFLHELTCHVLVYQVCYLVNTFYLAVLDYFVESVRRFRAWCSLKRVVGTHVTFCWPISTVNTGTISAMLRAEWFVGYAYADADVGPVKTNIRLD